MTPEDIQKIQETIRVTVNGKIDKMNQKLDDYIKTDNEWKENAKPAIALGNNVRGFGMVMAGLIGIVGGASAIIDAIVALIKSFKK